MSFIIGVRFAEVGKIYYFDPGKLELQLDDKAVSYTHLTLIEAKTYRYMGHSRSDKREYRTREEEEEWKKKDAIVSFAGYMVEHGFSRQEIDAIETQVERECEEAVEYAQAAEALTFEEAKELVFATEENI